MQILKGRNMSFKGVLFLLAKGGGTPISRSDFLFSLRPQYQYRVQRQERK